jgi:hypothetical protein
MYAPANTYGSGTSTGGDARRQAKALVDPTPAITYQLGGMDGHGGGIGMPGGGRRNKNDQPCDDEMSGPGFGQGAGRGGGIGR